MPWMRALPDRVAFGSFSMELGEVNMCLYALTNNEHPMSNDDTPYTDKYKKTAPE